MEEAQRPWHDDSLGRKDEAKTVADYLIARSAARRSGGKPQGFVLAVDAGYGEGKSYFIRNLKQELSDNHPVALIDAWADDRTIQPFFAILDALENALEPLFDKSPKLKANVGKLIEGSSELAWGLFKGVGKKALAKVAGEAAEGLVIDAIDKDVNAVVLENEERKATIEEIQADVSAVAESGVEQAIVRVEQLADGHAKAGLLDYRRTKQSALALKRRLAQIVDNIDVLGGYPSNPIFIFIDELDRCRPTYAIELLEEVKHLFDVAGIVFILCIHKDQLLHSINSVYGGGFDAKAYFDRFVDKAYSLGRPTARQFVERELAREPLPEGKFLSDVLGQTAASRIGQVFDHFGLSLREMERAIDMIRGCAFLTGSVALDPIYLSLAVCSEFGRGAYQSSSPRHGISPYKFSYRTPQSYNSPMSMEISGETTFSDLIQKIEQMGNWDRQTVTKEEPRDRPRAADEYGFQQIHRFYKQLAVGHDMTITQAELCADAILRFKPFLNGNLSDPN